MNRVECKTLCIDIYQDFFREIAMSYNYVCKLGEIEKKVMETYLNYLDKIYGFGQINAMFLLNYIEYQFYYWHEFDDYRFGKGKIPINWVFGKKAFERYESIKDTDWNNFKFKRLEKLDIGAKILVKYNVLGSTGDFRRDFNEMVVSSNPVEEMEKERFHNTEQGFEWCKIQTTLYNHKSHNCVVCDFREECKKILAVNYPKLNKKRGYE